jgi:hypothetical protein
VIFDRFSLVFLVMLAAARLFPQPAIPVSVMAIAFLARVTIAMKHASGFHGRPAPVVASRPNDIMTLRVSDLT